MKKKILSVYNAFRFTVAIAAIMGGMVLVNSSCNKSFPHLVDETDTAAGDQKFSVQQPKVLYLIIDGAQGSEVRAINPPGFNKLTRQSIYAWYGLADFSKTTIGNSEGWANMMTGVTRTKHGVRTDDFVGNNLSNYPSFIKRLKDVDNSIYVSAYSSSQAFEDHFTTMADVHSTLSSDDAVKNALINEIKTNSQADIVVGQFHDVDVAGATYGYKSSVSEYRAAIYKMDEQVQDVIAALQQRPGFAGEKWLVIVSSNRGSNVTTPDGSGDITAFADARRNTFTFLYNPSFQSQYVDKPVSTDISYSGKAVRYDNNPNATAARARVQNIRDFDMNATGGQYTIECNVKIATNNYYYPSILSKRKQFAGGERGWCFFLEGNYWQINMSNGSGNIQAAGSTVCDDKWHTLTAVMYDTLVGSATQRWVKVFTDGKFNNKRTMDDRKNLMNADTTLCIGTLIGDGGNPPFKLTNLRIFKAALPATVIEQYACGTAIDESHPYWNQLMGYWPCLDGSGNTLKDMSGNNKHFSLTGRYTWEVFDDFDPRLCVTPTDDFYRKVPNGVDMAYMVFSWLNIPAVDSWGFEGKAWRPDYGD